MLTERRGGLVCLVRRMILRAVRSEFVFPVSALAVLMTSVESRVNVLWWLLPCLMFSMSWQGDQSSSSDPPPRLGTELFISLSSPPSLQTGLTANTIHTEDTLKYLALNIRGLWEWYLENCLQYHFYCRPHQSYAISQLGIWRVLGGGSVEGQVNKYLLLEIENNLIQASHWPLPPDISWWRQVIPLATGPPGWWWWPGDTCPHPNGAGVSLASVLPSGEISSSIVSPGPGRHRQVQGQSGVPARPPVSACSTLPARTDLRHRVRRPQSSPQ